MTEQPDLFPVEESLSPFAAWKREHGIFTLCIPTNDEGIPYKEPWAACDPKYIDLDPNSTLGRAAAAFGWNAVFIHICHWGESEEKACEMVAAEMDIPHWFTPKGGV